MNQLFGLQHRSRTDPVIPNGNTGQNGAVWFYHSLSHSLHPVLVIGVNDGVVMS